MLLGNLPSSTASVLSNWLPLSVGTGLPDSKKMPASFSNNSMRSPSAVMVISTWSFRLWKFGIAFSACWSFSPPQQRQQQPRNGVVAALGGQIGQVQPHLRLVHRHHAVENENALLGLDPLAGHRRGVARVADDRLQHVGRGHHALEAAVLVEHQRHPQRVRLQPLQRVQRGHRVRNLDGITLHFLILVMEQESATLFAARYANSLPPK